MSSGAAVSSDGSETAPGSGWARRLDVYGVFWMRFLDWGVRRCPFFIEPLLIAGYTLFFLGMAGRQRRAVMENLGTLRPGAGWFGRLLGAWRVFREFAWMIVDAARSRSGERHVTWRIDGEPLFREVNGRGGGVLLLTAHMGNYDVAGPFFADKFGRTVHAVRRPERRADLQEYMEAQRQAHTGDSYRVQYNVDGGFLGVELAQALAAGEVVAIQGDRVADGMGAVEVEWRGRLWRLPSGPLVLAQVASAPVLPIFTLRDGWRSYRILFLPVREAAPAAGSRAERVAAREELAAWWAGTLAGVIERHWWQWLMFENAFAKLPAETSDASRVARPVVEAAPLPPRSPQSPQSRPERTTKTGWRPTLQPISRTYLGRWLNARGLLLPFEAPQQLRAEDSAQNWIELVVLAGFTGLLALAAVWIPLAHFLPMAAAVLLAPPAWFALLHLVPITCGTAADLLKRLPGVPRRWSLTRLSEELLFGMQTGFSAVLLLTPWRWLGAAWLAFAAANALAFLWLALACRRSKVPRGQADVRY